MEKQLQEDLAEVLEGLDPLELLIQDPALAQVAEEVNELIESAGGLPDNANLPARDDSGSPATENFITKLSSDSEHSAESSDTANTKLVSSGTLPSQHGNKSILKVPCEVCGRPAGGRLYYGAATCNSCRAFFSRSSKDNAYENFVCVNVDSDNNNLCQIDSTSWKSCQKCRYKKCEHVGMSMKSRKFHSGNETFLSFLLGHHLRTALILTDKLNNDERFFIRSIVLKRLNAKSEYRTKFLLHDSEQFRCRLEQFYQSKAMNLKKFKTFEDFVTYCQIQNFSNGEFSDDGLTKKDRVKLLINNFPLVIEFFEAYRLEMEKWKKFDPVTYLEDTIKDLSLEKKAQYHGIFNEVTQNGKLQPQKIGYVHLNYKVFFHYFSQ